MRAAWGDPRLPAPVKSRQYTDMGNWHLQITVALAAEIIRVQWRELLFREEILPAGRAPADRGGRPFKAGEN